MLEPIESFGAIDAENDERLIEYFYRTEIIDELLSYRRSIVIGRKGSGKTAIYKYIKNEKKNNCTALLFKDYPWKLMIDLKQYCLRKKVTLIHGRFLLY